MITRPARRILAMTAAAAFAIAPTIYVGWTAWRINRPGRVHEVEASLGEQIGLAATLRSVRYPRPGEIQYEGLVLRQEERRRKLIEIARADRVTLGRSGRDATIAVENLALHAETAGQALDQLGSFLRGSAIGSFDRINLVAKRCEIELGEGDDVIKYTVADLAGAYVAEAKSPSVFIGYRFLNESDSSSTRCELKLTRDRGIEPPRTTLRLQTVEGLPIAARALDPFFNTRERIGAKSRFEGTIELSRGGDSADWDIDFAGSLLDVDLAKLVGARDADFRLTGTAKIEVRTAKWRNRPGQGYGWSEASGEIVSSSGTIGLSLLRALRGEMRFRLNPKLARYEDRSGELEYHALGLTFDLGRDGELNLAGALGSEYPGGTVLVHANNITPLAFAPAGAANTRGLIKALFPVAPDALVPGTPEAQAYQRYLPLPHQIASREGAIHSN